MNDILINEMYTRITPELADDWLKKNTNNRPVREQFVKQLVKKIKNGEWQIETCDAIGFYEDGTLANGQHRLKAISLAGVPVYACVKYNIPKEAAVCIDSGKSRTAADNVRIATSGNEFYSSKFANAMRYAFINGSNINPEDHVRIVNKYGEEARFVYNCMLGCGKFLNNSAYIAALFLAVVNGEDRDKIRNFVDLLVSRKPSRPIEFMVADFAILLRQESIKKPTSRRIDYNFAINRFQNALYNFCKGKSLKKFTTTVNLRYPKVELP